MYSTCIIIGTQNPIERFGRQGFDGGTSLPFKSPSNNGVKAKKVLIVAAEGVCICFIPWRWVDKGLTECLCIPNFR